MKDDTSGHGRSVAETSVRCENYKEILEGKMSGFLRLLSIRSPNERGAKDGLFRVRRRIEGGCRHWDVVLQLGWAALVFMNESCALE